MKDWAKYGVMVYTERDGWHIVRLPKPSDIISGD